ncbi:MAG: nucleotide exchange factor GrpE [Microthrixaceae bacterium]|nr:nucleotide exchange factor GrpE [Microthrixaceae bacterium]
MTDQNHKGDQPAQPTDSGSGNAPGSGADGQPESTGAPTEESKSGGDSGDTDPFKNAAQFDADFPDITTDDAIDEDLVEMVEVGVRLQAERDEYLDLARRVQAEFENYKRRVEAQRVEQRARAAEDLAQELLPVLDAGEAATSQGDEHAAALHTQLLITLEKQGLKKVDEVGIEFDPKIHEAVLHEDGDADSPEVSEVMRTGYLWNDRVIRPAMVKVRG